MFKRPPEKSPLQNYCHDFKKHHPTVTLTEEQQDLVKKLANEAKDNGFSCLDNKEFSLLVDPGMRKYFSQFDAAIEERRNSTLNDGLSMI